MENMNRPEEFESVEDWVRHLAEVEDKSLGQILALGQSLGNHGIDWAADAYGDAVDGTEEDVARELLSRVNGITGDPTEVAQWLARKEVDVWDILAIFENAGHCPYEAAEAIGVESYEVDAWLKSC
jgi:predicted dienelactone hydrolase